VRFLSAQQTLAYDFFRSSSSIIWGIYDKNINYTSLQPKYPRMIMVENE